MNKGQVTLKLSNRKADCDQIKHLLISSVCDANLGCPFWPYANCIHDLCCYSMLNMCDISAVLQDMIKLTAVLLFLFFYMHETRGLLSWLFLICTSHHIVLQPHFQSKPLLLTSCPKCNADLILSRHNRRCTILPGVKARGTLGSV